VNKTLFVHIGTHKTGSKSLQSYLDALNPTLVTWGYRFYRGLQRDPRCHGELGLAALRPERDSFARYWFPDARGIEYSAMVRRHIQESISGSDTAGIIFSNEDLSYLRFSDELASLHDILGREHQIHIVVYLRERQSFLQSYRQQIRSVAGRNVSNDKSSAFYVDDDSWLADYHSLIRAYESEFSAERVHAVDYDHVLAMDGSILPSFMRALGLPEPGQEQKDAFFIHRTTVDGPAKT